MNNIAKINLFLREMKFMRQIMNTTRLVKNIETLLAVKRLSSNNIKERYKINV